MSTKEEEKGGGGEDEKAAPQIVIKAEEAVEQEGEETIEEMADAAGVAIAAAEVVKEATTAAAAESESKTAGGAPPAILTSGGGAAAGTGAGAPFNIENRRRLKQEAYVTKGCGKNEVKTRIIGTFWDTVWPALEGMGWTKVGMHARHAAHRDRQNIFLQLLVIETHPAWLLLSSL